MADLIDRQAAISALKRFMDFEWKAYKEPYKERYIDIIKDVPAVVEERKQGCDICYSVKDHHCEFKCSVCGEEIIEHWGGNFSFCPYCGADMRGTANE